MTEEEFKDLLTQKGWWNSAPNYFYKATGLPSSVYFKRPCINLYYMYGDFKEFYSTYPDTTEEELLFLQMSHPEKQFITFKELLDIVVSL